MCSCTGIILAVVLYLCTCMHVQARRSTKWFLLCAVYGCLKICLPELGVEVFQRVIYVYRMGVWTYVYRSANGDWLL